MRLHRSAPPTRSAARPRCGPDHLGSPRLVTSQNGQTEAYHAYWPYGEEATSGTYIVVAGANLAGVYKHRSIEDAQKLSDAWDRANFERYQARLERRRARK